MEYTTDVIDRRTGDLVTQSLGEWKTVTELAVEYETGKNEFRHILTAMGLLAGEGRDGRRRLTREAVRYDYGKRIDPKARSRIKYPFDVISPKGQEYIAAQWADTLSEIEAERQSSSPIAVATEELAHFEANRRTGMTAQMRVCWLLDHMPDITHEEIGSVICSTRQLVSHYARIRDAQRTIAGRRASIRDLFPDEWVLAERQNHRGL